MKGPVLETFHAAAFAERLHQFYIDELVREELNSCPYWQHVYFEGGGEYGWIDHLPEVLQSTATRVLARWRQRYG